METVLTGLSSGVFGIAITYLIQLILNIHSMFEECQNLLVLVNNENPKSKKIINAAPADSKNILTYKDYLPSSRL